MRLTPLQLLIGAGVLLFAFAHVLTTVPVDATPVDPEPLDGEPVAGRPPASSPSSEAPRRGPGGKFARRAPAT